MLQSTAIHELLGVWHNNTAAQASEALCLSPLSNPVKLALPTTPGIMGHFILLGWTQNNDGEQFPRYRPNYSERRTWMRERLFRRRKVWICSETDSMRLLEKLLGLTEKHRRDHGEWQWEEKNVWKLMVWKWGRFTKALHVTERKLLLVNTSCGWMHRMHSWLL